MRTPRSRTRKEDEPSGRKRFKGVFVVLLMGGFGVGMYFAGQARLFQSGEPVASVEQVAPAPVKKEAAAKSKKSASAKPKRACGALLSGEEPRKEAEQFTFFKTLNDPGLNRYVNLEGQVVKKAFSVAEPAKPPVKRVSLAKTPAPVAKTTPATKPSEPVPVKEKPAAMPAGKKEVQVEKKQQLRQKKAPEQVAQVAEHKPEEKTGGTQWVLDSLNALGTPQEIFRVQAGSFKKFEQASAFEGELKKKGYVAFIRPTEIPSKGTWYRVFLGQYASREEAEREAAQAGKKLGIRPVVKKVD